MPDGVTSRRLFIGYTDQTTATMGGNDDPPGAHCAGLQYSSARGDTTYQFIVKDAITLGIQDSGVSVIANAVQHFLILMEATEIRFTLLNNLYVPQVTRTFTANLPGLTQSMRQMTVLQNLAGGAPRFINHFWGKTVIRL
jgi:hypothetical protein